MSRPKHVVEYVRINVYIAPDLAAQLRLACANTSFGGIHYGEQKRIVNQALREFFEKNPPKEVSHVHT